MTIHLQRTPLDEPLFQFLDKKRAEGKPYYVYMTAAGDKFLRAITPRLWPTWLHWRIYHLWTWNPPDCSAQSNQLLSDLSGRHFFSSLLVLPFFLYLLPTNFSFVRLIWGLTFYLHALIIPSVTYQFSFNRKSAICIISIPLSFPIANGSRQTTYL